MAPRADKSSNVWAQVAYYTSLGFILPAGMAVAYTIGWALDRWLHTEPLLAVVMAFLGAGAGIYEVLVILKRAEKREERNDGGGGPRAG